MLDNQLYQLILSTINPQLKNVGIPGVVIAQAYQPWRQGVDPQQAAYLYKLGDHRQGFPRNANVWDSNQQKEIYTQLQVYQTTFQMSTLAIQDPVNNNQLTASDIVNLLAAILQNSITVQTFINQGVGILDIKDIRNPYFIDDQNRYEAAPSFDFTLTHTQVLSTTVPFTTVVDLTVSPIN